MVEEKFSRRSFLKRAAVTSAGLAFLNNSLLETIVSKCDAKPSHNEFDSVPEHSYEDIELRKGKVQSLINGLDYQQFEIYRKGQLVDRVNVVTINPENNRIQTFTNYDEQTNEANPLTIEQWQEKTNASLVINSAQYQASPWGRPCALMISDGKLIGPRKNKSSRGMLLAEPNLDSHPLADLIDFQFDEFDYETTPYTQGVQHFPILLNREGEIRVLKTEKQANRTVIGKDFDNNILAMTTEAGYFTLFNFARFLKESGLDIHTAMNLDGGYEAQMSIKTPRFQYVSYGQFETKGFNESGRKRDISVLGAKAVLPSVIGVFPRN